MIVKSDENKVEKTLCKDHDLSSKKSEKTKRNIKDNCKRLNSGNTILVLTGIIRTP